MEWAAGVDYVRLTHTDPARAAWAYEVYRQAVQELGWFYTGEAPLAAWGIQGYKGEISGKAAAGLREDGAILQVTSHWADTEDLLGLPSTGVPRLDIQVTTWGEAQPERIPRVIANTSFEASQRVSNRPWEVACYDKYGRGDTAYLGSRQSEWFVRVYDKARESGEAIYAGAIRYEVQITGATAKREWAEMQRAGKSPARIAGLVQGYLGARGISLPDGVSLEDSPRQLVRKEPSTTEQSIRWLGEQVAPTVARLLRKGVRYEDLHQLLFNVAHTGEFDATRRVGYNTGAE